MASKPKIGLVLGAGSARGFAHIGVLQVLKENNIDFDFMVGSSMGALIGAVAGTGSDLYMMGKLASNFNFNNIIDVSLPRLGFVAGRKAEQFIKLVTKNKTFADLNYPLYVVATDLLKGQPVIIEEGPLWEAIRASTSIPGVFRPWRQGETYLVDGAVTSRLPVEIAREKGADIIIAVDVIFAEGKEVKIRNTLDVIMHSIEIMERRIFENLVRDQADILIQPPLGDIFSSEFDKAEICIARGREAAVSMLPNIYEKLELN
ncbi:MAG: patatin-like phospholipase family protein [Methylocystaceae bacterium]